MRVAFVTCFSDVMLETSGASIRICNLARNLASLGHEVQVLIPANANTARQTRGFTLSKIHGVTPLHLLKILSGFFGVSNPLSLLFYDLLFIIRVLNEVRRSDIVQIEQPWAAGLLPQLIKLALKGLLVIDSHDTFQALRIGRSFSRKAIETTLEKMGYKCADMIIVVSEKEREILVSSGVARQKIRIIPNGVDTTVFCPKLADDESLKNIRRRYCLGDAPTAVFVGNMTYFPNLEAVRAIDSTLAPMIRDKIGRMNFLMVGRPPDSDNAFQTSNLIFTGLVEKVADFLSVSDVAIAPLFHGSGSRLKIIEYLACGLPVVSTAMGAEGLEVKEGTNILVEDDMKEFAARVVDLIEDKKLARRLGSEARELAANRYDWKTITGQLDEAYHSLARSRADVAGRHVGGI